LNRTTGKGARPFKNLGRTGKGNDQETTWCLPHRVQGPKGEKLVLSDGKKKTRRKRRRENSGKRLKLTNRVGNWGHGENTKPPAKG